MTSLPLSRFKVIDLTRARAGPTCARILGDWGADVIKVEAKPGAGGDDLSRAAQLRLPEPAPQQAQHHARPEAGGSPAGALPPRRDRRCRGGELPARREAPAA